MATALIAAGLVIALALLISLHRKIDRIPAGIWAIVREERAREDQAAMIALRDAAAAKVAGITQNLRQYEEQTAEAFRALVANADTRAQLAERRSIEAGVALSAASELVRELRATLDGLGVQSGNGATVVESDARKTLKLGALAPADDGAEEPEDEPTKVGKPAAGSGLRLAARPPESGRGGAA